MDAESAKLFASLLSDLGWQVQESVFSLTYLDSNASDCTGVEYFIKCDTSDRHKVADALEKAGFENYTINADGVQILDFKKQETDQSSNDKQSLTADNTDTSTNESNFADTVKALSKTLSGTLSWQKFNSDYLGVHERQELYNNFLNQNTDGQAELYNQGRDGGQSGRDAETGNTLRQQASPLNNLINEALKNLQSFQQGQKGVDLTNDLQNGEEEYTLNTPLTPTQLARSQLDAESAKLFTSLLSDLGYQVQESVIAASYVDDSTTDYTGVETFIECNTSDRHAIAQILEDAGITDYTINNEGITILWFGTKEEIENLKAKEKTPKVEIQKAYYTRKQVEKEQDKVFLFGDNIEDAKNNYTPRSTQAVIRGLQNAIGIPTKKTRGTQEKDYFTDSDFEEAKKLIDEAIDKAVKSGKIIVIPKDGIGTGKAELAKRAPKINDYLQAQLKKLQDGKLTAVVSTTC